MMVFMMIELVGAVCYSAILYSEPVGIEELKPYLFRAVQDIMTAHRTVEPTVSDSAQIGDCL